MQRRELGRTGERLSVVGFGGIVVMKETAEDAARYVGRAIDRGINYFDVAPTYGDAEERLGPALEPFRNKVFLSCKTAERTAAGATRDLENSLRRLRTDRFDLYQLHGLASMEEVKQVRAADGALGVLASARERGVVRFLGFSAHSETAACSLLEAFEFDVVTFPINYVTWLKGNMGPRVLEAARRKGMGVIALKALARCKWMGKGPRKWPKCWYMPVETPQEAALALRFTLSKPVTTAVSPSHAELLWWQCDAARSPAPLTPAEEAYLRQQAAALTPVFAPEPA